MTDEGVVLVGLDGGTPLGFLAALGVVRVLEARQSGCERAASRMMLSWRLRDHWCPVIYGVDDLEEVVERVAADAALWADAPILRFRYPKQEKQGIKMVGALQAPVAVLRCWLRDRIAAGDTESLEYAAALMSETGSEPRRVPVTNEVLDDHGIPYDPAAPITRSTIPTAFDFTSRNAQFLEQVEVIRASLDADGIRNVLRAVASGGVAPRTLDWDPAADAPGAIYGPRTSMVRAAAEWLAFRGLVFFPVAGQGETLRTTACRGRRKAGVFVWPIWKVPVKMSSITSLLRCRDLDRISTPERRERGIVQVFRAQLTKKADGYSGMFAPSEAA